MKKVLSLALALIVVSSAFSILATLTSALPSEPPVLEWNRTYGGTSDDVAWSVVQSSDGGYAIAGWTVSFGAGGEDFWLIKTDVHGNMEWNKTYGDTDWERAYCLIQTQDGGYAIAGETRPYATMYCNRDFLLVKTNTNGNVQWTQTYDRAYQDLSLIHI